MKNTPQISIVMPLFNKREYVKRAIKSVLSQTFSDFELIVINDGSTDKGYEAVKSFDDARVILIHQENSGVSVARNRGIDAACSDFIAFIDADDEWMPNFLETIMDLKESYPFCKVFSTSYFYCLKGVTYPLIIRGLPNGFKKGVLKDYFFIASRSRSPVHSSTVAVEKNVINTIGKFPSGIAIGEDLLTWARLASRYDIAYSTEPCAVIHCPINISERPGRIPDIEDFVGKELVNIMKSIDPKRGKGLKEYIAAWYRGRSVIFIQLGQCDQAIVELKKALKYSTSLKAIALLLLSVMPSKMPQLMHKGIHNARRFLQILWNKRKNKAL